MKEMTLCAKGRFIWIVRVDIFSLLFNCRPVFSSTLNIYLFVQEIVFLYKENTSQLLSYSYPGTETKKHWDLDGVLETYFGSHIQLVLFPY